MGGERGPESQLASNVVLQLQGRIFLTLMCRGSCFLSYTAESSHHLMAAITPKEGLVAGLLRPRPSLKQIKHSSKKRKVP